MSSLEQLQKALAKLDATYEAWITEARELASFEPYVTAKAQYLAELENLRDHAAIGG